MKINVRWRQHNNDRSRQRAKMLMLYIRYTNTCKDPRTLFEFPNLAKRVYTRTSWNCTRYDLNSDEWIQKDKDSTQVFVGDFIKTVVLNVVNWYFGAFRNSKVPIRGVPPDLSRFIHWFPPHIWHSIMIRAYQHRKTDTCPFWDLNTYGAAQHSGRFRFSLTHSAPEGQNRLVKISITKNRETENRLSS